MTHGLYGERKVSTEFTEGEIYRRLKQWLKRVEMSSNTQF